MPVFRKLLVLGAVALLAACGGGGGGGEEPPPGGGGGGGGGTTTYSVGGTLSGLAAGKSVVVAQAPSGPSATLSANGPYSLALPVGTTYDLRIQTQPVGQTCAVTNGTGTVQSDVSSIAVACADSAATFKIGGTVSGLGAGQAVALVLNASGALQELSVAADGRFEFTQAVSGPYSVTVKTAPAGLGCAVTQGEGTASAESGNVQVGCTGNRYRLSGTASGLLAAVSLRNTGNGETLAVDGNGTFAFAQTVAHGAAYDVQVASAGGTQICSVANGSGAAMADIANVQLSCAAVVVNPPPPPPPPAPSTPANLTLTYSAKTFNFAWGTVTGATSYRLLEDIDGVGPLAPVQVATLTGNTASYYVSALLHTRLNAGYRVQACNAGGCSTATAAVTPNLTQAIGYFKASNTDAGSEFGNSLALSSDGMTLAVGAWREDSSSSGVGGAQGGSGSMDSGAVYVFVRSGGMWVQQAYVKASSNDSTDGFGIAVALSADGNTLAVGASGEDSNATGINGNQLDNSALNSGAVYVFLRSAGTWTQQAYIKASNTGTRDGFGNAVALSADGNTLAVGASLQEGDNSGAAYVFARNAGMWAQQAFIKASNAGANNFFGQSVALSGDGNTLAVGAAGEDSNATGINGDQANNLAPNAGAAYVFVRNVTTWTQQAYIKASNADAGDSFGYPLALSGDGTTLAVGARSEDSNAAGIGGNGANNLAAGSGAVYVFVRNAATWTQQAYVKASFNGIGDQFGISVALSADGSTLAVGSPDEDSSAVGVGGDQANDGVGGSGAVYLLVRRAGVWSHEAYLKAPNTGGLDAFGSTVALSGNGTTLAVGAIGEASNATGIGGNQSSNGADLSGAVYLY